MSADNEFNDLVGTWYNPLYRFALSLAHNDEDAQDLTQTTFLKWAKKGDTLRQRDKAKTWLFSVLYREFLDQARKSKRFPKSELDDERLPAPNGPSAERRLDAATAMAALAELDERFRAPLILFYMENHSYQEIAEILDIPIGTVMSRLRRGKDRLRASMERGESSPGDVIPFPRKEAQS
jgi:RNA polymerase sigma factor (sigma-70 family)